MIDLNFNSQVNDLEVTYLHSLWNLLSLRRVVLLSEHGQDPFDQLNDAFKVNLTNQGSEEDSDEFFMSQISKGKRFVNLTNLFSLLNVVYKFIVFKLVFIAENEEADLAEMSMSDVLTEILDEPIFGKTSDDERIDLNEYNFADIKVKHVAHLWKLLVKIFSNLKNN